MPETVNDPVLGRLKWDDKLEWWVAPVEFVPGQPIEVFVDHDPEGVPDAEIAAGRRGLALVREREAEYRRWSAEQFHRTRWNSDEPMTVEDIARLLRVASLLVRPDGSVRVYWDDQDVLFYGHNIFTEVAADGSCRGTEMEG